MRKALARFMSDLRDLWTLITRGQPGADDLLPWRMAAEFAKMQVPGVDLDRWERDQFAANAFWFDPERYDDTPFAWPKRQPARPVTALDHVHLIAVQQAQSQAAYAAHLASLQNASTNRQPYFVLNQMQTPYGGLGDVLGIGRLF